VKAVMAAGLDDLRDLVARAEAVTAVRGSEDFLAVSAAFKRMKNILAQAEFELDRPPLDAGGSLALGDPHSALSLKATNVAAQVQMLRKQKKYIDALQAMATVRPEVDQFFEKVMVMDTDLEVRNRRLTLLSLILSGFSGIADFSEIVSG
jgi:glycyl-tRNA synthetase beta chain